MTMAGGPIELDLNLIDEDPEQPRTEDNPGFSPESIAEIGQTIKDRGVKSPISVRENPKQPGRYLINHGARRYRGSRWAGKITIPAFIDNDYNEIDQVIENLQRNELTAREIANFVGREVAKGKTFKIIAEEIGKSTAFVSQHVTLLNLPDPVAEVFNQGRVRDVTLVNELVKAYKADPDMVSAWLADERREINRGLVKELREYLDSGDGRSGNEPPPGNNVMSTRRVVDTARIRRAIVRVDHDGRAARLLIDRRPSADGKAWLGYDDGGLAEVDLACVRLVAVLGE